MDSSQSDEEIFFGKLSLREVRTRLQKRILFDDNNDQRQTIGCVHLQDETDTSLQLIETQSEPDYISIRDSVSEDSPQKSGYDKKQSTQLDSPTNISSTTPDDSFLKLEEMVSEYTENKNNELDNTLEVVEYILKHVPCKNKVNVGSNNVNDVDVNQIIEAKESRLVDESPEKWDQSDTGTPKVTNTPASFHTPKVDTKHFKTPCKDINMKTPLFKTPANVLLPQKSACSGQKQIPSRNFQYTHIVSPVACYIRKCPQVPQVQEVHPTKPLPAGPSSSIPKFLKNNSQTSSRNKENIVNLPPLAYKSATKTKMIYAPSISKLPVSQRAKKLVPSLPRPVVITHDHRENNLLKKVKRQEDSFADLSLHQADTSHCTQKSALNKPK